MALTLINLPFGAAVYMAVDASEVLDYLEGIKSSGADMRPVMREMANTMRRSFAQNFREGGRPEKWARLKQGTVFGKSMSDRSVYSTMRGRAKVSRLAQFRANSQQPLRSLTNILVQRGDLRDSYVTKSRFHVEKIGKFGLETGSKHPLAAIHEYGTGTFGRRGSKYLIKPVRARSLRWFGEFGPVFAGQVWHPGVPARPVAILQPEDMDKLTDLAAGRLFD